MWDIHYRRNSIFVVSANSEAEAREAFENGEEHIENRNDTIIAVERHEGDVDEFGEVEEN